MTCPSPHLHICSLYKELEDMDRSMACVSLMEAKWQITNSCLLISPGWLRWQSWQQMLRVSQHTASFKWSVWVKGWTEMRAESYFHSPSARKLHLVKTMNKIFLFPALWKGSIKIFNERFFLKHIVLKYEGNTRRQSKKNHDVSLITEIIIPNKPE